MMDFLEKLYSNENFGIYLVVIIAILVLLFFIVLFLGKKDSKKENKNEGESQQLVKNEQPVVLNKIETPVEAKPILEPVMKNDLTSENVVTKVEPVKFESVESPVSISTFKEVTDSKPLEVSEDNIKSNVTNNVVLNESNKKESVDETKEFDFDALAEAINKELESIKEAKKEAEIVEESKPVIEEKPFAFPTFETVEPDNIPEPLMHHEEVKEEVKPVIEEKPKTIMPNVFSSVYVKRDEPKVENVSKPVAPPPFELPKMADLPKKASNNESSDIHSVLDNIDVESYQINK